MCNCASSKSCKAEMGRLLGAIPLVVDRYHRDGSSGGIYTQIYMHYYIYTDIHRYMHHAVGSKYQM